MKRSKHSLSNYKLLTCDMGELVPIGCQEVLMGDSIQQQTSALIRMSPMLSPVMHPVHARIHHMFIPNRLLWDSWDDFITGGPDGLNASAFPIITSPSVDGFAEGSLADYLGVPTGVPDMEVSALPFRAYQLVYNEYYRDQNLDPESVIDTGDGSDTITDVDLKLISWEKDYFTTARTTTQLGSEVSLPLGTEAPITGLGSQTLTPQLTTTQARYETDGSGTVDYANSSNIDTANVNQILTFERDSSTGYPNIRADLANATAATVNQLREAFAIQSYQEARLRYGHKIVDYLRYHGIKASDARIQRPEYLAGGKQTVQFSEVIQTTPTTSTAVGTLRGHGIGAMRSNRFRQFFEESGILMSFLSIRPKTMYVDGLNKFWNKHLKEDFWQKQLERIGQEPVLNKEIYAAHTDPDGIFGYQDRYSEYRQTPSTIAGQFRSTLNYWHLARIFTTDPALNASFVNCNPSKRIFAVQDADNDAFQIMANHSVQARRFVSRNATPSNI